MNASREPFHRHDHIQVQPYGIASGNDMTMFVKVEPLGETAPLLCSHYWEIFCSLPNTLRKITITMDNKSTQKSNLLIAFFFFVVSILKLFGPEFELIINFLHEVRNSFNLPHSCALLKARLVGWSIESSAFGHSHALPPPLTLILLLRTTRPHSHSHPPSRCHSFSLSLSCSFLLSVTFSLTLTLTGLLLAGFLAEWLLLISDRRFTQFIILSNQLPIGPFL